MMVGEPQVVAENIEVFQPVLVRLSVFTPFTDSSAEMAMQENLQPEQAISGPNNDDLTRSDRRATFCANGTQAGESAGLMSGHTSGRNFGCAHPKGGHTRGHPRMSLRMFGCTHILDVRGCTLFGGRCAHPNCRDAYASHSVV